MTLSELEAMYQWAMAGSNEPDCILLPRPVLKEVCYKTGEVGQWLSFVRSQLVDPEARASRRLDPRRLPE